MTHRLDPMRRVAACALVTAFLPLWAAAESYHEPGEARPQPRIERSVALPGASPHHPRRLLRAAEPGQAADTPTFWIESGPVTFGAVVPGQATRLDRALQIRVFSRRPYLLKLVATAPLRTDNGNFAPAGRLSWRSGQSGGFVPFSEGGWGLVWRGEPTSAAGRLVDVDLRLALEDSDPLGSYVTPLRVAVEPL